MKHSDFKVKYKFRTYEQGGRKIPVFQGYRSDFWYYHEEVLLGHIYMMWPTFEDELGNILENSIAIPKQGIARMTTISESNINYHISRLKIVTKGYFMEASRKVVECEVIELGERLSL